LRAARLEAREITGANPLLLSDLGVTKTHSRPHVSNDNPYSEALFKTLKYQPNFPDRFPSREAARLHCGPYFDWYNTEHHHAGIAFLTPHDVHYVLAQARLERRAAVLLAAHASHPERFVSRPPVPQPLPAAVWIRPPDKEPPTPVISAT
jgi:putative transposase